MKKILLDISVVVAVILLTTVFAVISLFGTVKQIKIC